MRHRQRGHHRRTPLPVQSSLLQQPGRLLHDRRLASLAVSGPHHELHVPSHEQARIRAGITAFASSSLARSTHDRRAYHGSAGSLLRRVTVVVRRPPRALLPVGHPHQMTASSPKDRLIDILTD